MRQRTRVSAIAIAALTVVSSVSVGAYAVGEPPVRGSVARIAAAPTFQPPATELNLVTISPCRIVNTNGGTGAGATPLGNQTSRTYYVAGTSGFTGQGGKAGGCGVPLGAAAIAATIAAVDPTHAGYLRTWPSNLPETSSTILNYGTFSTSTGATVAIDTDVALGLKVRNYHGPTDLIIDITGYYVKPLSGMISPAGVPYAGSSRIVSATHAALGTYDVVFDRVVSYCSATASVYNSPYYASVSTFYANPNGVRVFLQNADGALVDQYFYINVSC